MKRILFGFAAFACFASLVHIPSAKADLITIVNHSFEDPSLPDGQVLDPANWNGWTFAVGTGSTWNITGSAFWNTPAPDGNNVGYLTNSLEPGIPAEATQSLGVNLLADSIYELRFFAGHPIGFSTGTTFTTDLRAGGNVLASVSGSGPEGSFQEFQFLFDSAGSSFVGQELSVNFFTNQPQTAFDNVRLSVTSVPEPSSLTMLVVVAVSTILRRKNATRGRTKRSTQVAGLPRI